MSHMEENPIKRLNTAQLKIMNKINKALPARLTRVDDGPPRPDSMLSVWRSRHFIVQEHRHHNCIRLTINRTTVTRTGEWDSNISWEELQQIKRDVGHGDRVAVEIFPKDQNVVNVANMRHLWIPDTPPDYGNLHGDD